MDDPQTPDGFRPGRGVDQVGAVQDWLAARGIEVPGPERPTVGLVAVGRTEGLAGTEDLASTEGRARSSVARRTPGARSSTAVPGSACISTSVADRRTPTDSSGAGSDGERDQAREDDVAGKPGGELGADPETVARGIVVRKLASRACTRHELERALATKGIPAEVARRVLDRMEELRLVDDASFAADWVASRQQRRHLSARALTRELTQKGVAREQIATAVAQVEPEDEYAAALSLAQRRAATTVGLPADTRYRRLATVLGRRGFGPATTARVLAETLGASSDAVDGR